MAKDPALLFYTSDFLTGTTLMTHEQVGIYIRMICVLHQHGGIIDKDAFHSFIGPHEIVKKKFKEVENGFIHARLASEMDRRNKYCESRRQNRTKKDMSNISSSYVERMETETVTVIDNVIDNEDIVVFNNKAAFEIAWAKYPVKDGKKAAERHFKGSVRSQADFDDLMAAMANYIKSEKVLKGYVKNGSTWFNNWQDWKTYIPPYIKQPKQSADMIAVNCRAARLDKAQTKEEIIKKGYSEHAADNAIMVAWEEKR